VEDLTYEKKTQDAVLWFCLKNTRIFSSGYKIWNEASQANMPDLHAWTVKSKKRETCLFTVSIFNIYWCKENE